MMQLNKACPFCGAPLKLEQYDMSRKRGVSGWQTEIFCDNDNCDTKPSAINGSVRHSLADVEAWRVGREADHG